MEKQVITSSSRKFQMKIKVNKQCRYKIVTVNVNVTYVKANLGKKISFYSILTDLELQRRSLGETSTTKTC